MVSDPVNPRVAEQLVLVGLGLVDFQPDAASTGLDLQKPEITILLNSHLDGPILLAGYYTHLVAANRVDALQQLDPILHDKADCAGGVV